VNRKLQFQTEWVLKKQQSLHQPQLRLAVSRAFNFLSSSWLQLPLPSIMELSADKFLFKLSQPKDLKENLDQLDQQDRKVHRDHLVNVGMME